MKSLLISSSRQKLFNSTPQLNNLLTLLDKEILLAFLSYAESHQLKMDWTTHVYLLNWLIQNQIVLSADIKKELLIASTQRWVQMGLEHVKAKGILIRSQHLPFIAIGIWKNIVANQNPTLVELKLSQSASWLDSYAISYQLHNWDGLHWQNIDA